jgi:sugar lactone lactonase YvrE
MDELIRATIHDALDVREPAGLRSRVIAAVPIARSTHRPWRMPRINGQWAVGVAAILLTAALLLALMSSRIGLRPQPSKPIAPGIRLTNPSGVAIAPDGTVYVADYANSRVYRLQRDGTLARVAGGGLQYEGLGTKSNIFGPMQLAFAPNSDLYVAEMGGTRISRIDPNGNLSTFYSSFAAQVWGVAFSPSGMLYASPYARVAAIHADGSVFPIDLSAVPGPAIWPGYMTFDSAGNLYVADLAPSVSTIQLTPPLPGGCRILRITPEHSVSVIAGTGLCGYSGDGGPASQAQLGDPNGIAFDAAGNMYVADSKNYRIRRIDTHGVITTVAGKSRGRHTGDNGPAANAELSYLSGVAVAQGRYLYFSEQGGLNAYGAVRVIDLQTGIIRTVVDSYSQVVS